MGGAIACMARADRVLQENSNPDPVMYLITGRRQTCQHKGSDEDKVTGGDELKKMKVGKC
ncbi:unnamed protein product [Gongylonema pulchrum]|uniref:Uncharacterized protein n=1 Tax=Gongylonema pulchrum TaxID=637853 RepID=A0A183ELY1_9BILA|nr:unnamed protein product [Gongylonema pulchrum]